MKVPLAPHPCQHWIFSVFLKIYLFSLFFWLHWVFVAARVLLSSCGAQAFSSCGEQGLLFIVVCGLLTAGASLVVEHGL